MHFRTQQGKRRYFSEAGLDPNDHTFGGISIILVLSFMIIISFSVAGLTMFGGQYAQRPLLLKGLTHNVLGNTGLFGGRCAYTA